MDDRIVYALETGNYRCALNLVIGGWIKVDEDTLAKLRALDLPITPQLLEFLGGVMPGPILDAGTGGTIYELTETTILKSSHYVGPVEFAWNDIKGSDEVILGVKAWRLGVGPKIHRATILKGPTSNNDLLCIVMQRLSGPTLELIYPPTASILSNILDLCYVLIRNGIEQNDIKPDNLMFDQGRLYIIDYGCAVVFYPHDLAEYFSSFIPERIELLTSETDWWDTASPQDRSRIFLDLIHGGQAWLDEHFPGTLVGPSTLKVDEAIFGDGAVEIRHVLK